MKAYEIMTDIIGRDFLESAGEYTVDRLKFGDENAEISKIATCLTVTPNLIREMKEWGAELVITHEPTFYNHEDNFTPTKLSLKKRAALEDAGFTVYRYHDSMHGRGVDRVNLAMIKRLGWEGDFDGHMHISLSCPVSAREIALAAREKLGTEYPRIVGNPDFKAAEILLATGARGGRCYKDFSESETEQIAVSGELCEWEDCEPVRDAAQFGEKKAIVILGHAGSEKFAMENLALEIDGKYDGAAARYFDCGEIYTAG